MPKRHAGGQHKNVVLTLVERGGKARSFHVDGNRWDDIVPVVQQNLNRESAMMTDEAVVYRGIGQEWRRTARSIMPKASMAVATSTPTPLRATTASSNAE
jgi:hypothetical protein